MQCHHHPSCDLRMAMIRPFRRRRTLRIKQSLMRRRTASVLRPDQLAFHVGVFAFEVIGDHFREERPVCCAAICARSRYLPRGGRAGPPPPRVDVAGCHSWKNPIGM